MSLLKGVKVLVGPSSFSAMDKTPMDKLISAGCHVIDNPYKRKLTKPELIDLLSNDVLGLIAGLENLDREILEKSNLKVISRVGSGLSNVDMEAAKELGIEVLYTPYGPTTAVAELTLGVLLCMIRMVPQMDNALHKGVWQKKIGIQLEGKTVAIIGFGRIGHRVAELLSSFKVKILIVDPYLKDDVGDYTVISLEKALPQADIITIHCSGNECILGEKEFSLVKPNTYLLNSARGELISEEALKKALDNGLIAGVWLDTFNNEPYNGPLTQYPQIVLTPHISSYTYECRKQMETEAVDNLINALIKIKADNL